MWFFGNWFHGWFGGFGFLGFVAIVTLVIVLAVRSGNRGREERRSSRPEDILKERLAKGEIDEQTYEELLKKVR